MPAWKGLNTRHLLILRNAPPPTAPTSQNLTQEFLAAGGMFGVGTDSNVEISAPGVDKARGLRVACERHGIALRIDGVSGQTVARLTLPAT